MYTKYKTRTRVVVNAPASQIRWLKLEDNISYDEIELKLAHVHATSRPTDFNQQKKNWSPCARLYIITERYTKRNKFLAIFRRKHALLLLSMRPFDAAFFKTVCPLISFVGLRYRKRAANKSDMYKQRVNILAVAHTLKLNELLKMSLYRWPISGINNLPQN